MGKIWLKLVGKCVKSVFPKENTGREMKRRWMLCTRAAVSREISNAAVLAAITVFTQTQIVTSTSTAQHSQAHLSCLEL